MLYGHSAAVLQPLVVDSKYRLRRRLAAPTRPANYPRHRQNAVPALLLPIHHAGAHFSCLCLSFLLLVAPVSQPASGSLERARQWFVSNHTTFSWTPGHEMAVRRAPGEWG
jgi:hypothetical protein